MIRNAETDSNKNEKKKCKGIKQNVVQKEITFNDYVECLLNETEEMHTMNIIKSKDHNIYSVKINKINIALSANDDKRITSRNKTDTLALRK